MRSFPSDVAFTPAAQAVPIQTGSPRKYARTEEGEWHTTVTPDLAKFLGGLDMVYLATASASGLPYVQYRGGPSRFLKVLDEHTLAFADFDGTRQYVTVDNLSENPRAFLFLTDYPDCRQAKVWGTARVIEGDAAMEEQLRDPTYSGKIDRVILFTVEAWDVNGPQQIRSRFTQGQLDSVIAQIQSRVRDLGAEIERLRADANSTN